MPKIRETLSDLYFRNFCTKLATDILQKYLDVIMKQRRISEAGAQQLLLDTYNVKTMLLQLPHLTSEGAAPVVGTAPPSSYVKLVNARVTHIEIVLKLIATPEEMLVERFRIMWPEGQLQDLQAVMALRDMKRADQQRHLEVFGLSSSPRSGSSGVSPSAPPSSSFTASAGLMTSVRSLTQDLSSTAFSAFRGTY